MEERRQAMKRTGRFRKVIRRDAARNARPKKLLLRHGGNSRALRYADLDLRSTAGREYRARVQALTTHLGGAEAVSTPQRILIDHAARLHLLGRLAWDELSRTGAFKDGNPRPAYDTYRRAAADERSVLTVLGIERKAKYVPDLHDYIKRKRLPLKDVSEAEEVG